MMLAYYSLDYIGKPPLATRHGPNFRMRQPANRQLLLNQGFGGFPVALVYRTQLLGRLLKEHEPPKIV